MKKAKTKQTTLLEAPLACNEAWISPVIKLYKTWVLYFAVKYVFLLGNIEKVLVEKFLETYPLRSLYSIKQTPKMGRNNEKKLKKITY